MSLNNQEFLALKFLRDNIHLKPGRCMKIADLPATHWKPVRQMVGRGILSEPRGVPNGFCLTDYAIQLCNEQEVENLIHQGG